MKSYTPDQRIINRLLIKLDSEFFSLSKEEQDKKRQHFYYNHSNEINMFLFRELFNIEYDPEWDSGDDPLTNQQLHQLNANTTLLCGIGENSFRLNELQDDSFDLTSYQTLYEKDVDHFNYQQQCIERDFPENYKAEAYRLYLNGDWARILDEDQHFHYVTLSSLSFYILDQLRESDDESIQNLLPYTWEEGKDNEKPVKGGFQWDWERNANGREAELDELLDRVRTYQNSRFEELNETFDQSENRSIYLKRSRSDRDGPSIEIIINNSKSAKQVRFTHLLRDCILLQKPAEELESLVKDEVSKQRTFIESAFRDIDEHFDPKVVKLKKKNKIIFAPDALSDLERIAKDESEERS